MQSDESINLRISDLELVRKAGQGEDTAFHELVDRYANDLFRLAYSLTGNADDAEDILQETFIKAFRHIDTFRNEQSGAFQAWLQRICVNNSISHLRKMKRRRDNFLSLSDMHTEPTDKNSSPEEKVEHQRFLNFVEQAVNRLSPKQKVIFDLRYTQHKTIRSIAHLLGSSESNVKTQLSRSVKKLRKSLKPLWEET